MPERFRIEAPARGPLLVRLGERVGEVVLALPALERLAAAGFELRLYGESWAPALFAGMGWPVTVREGDVVQDALQLRDLRENRARPALLLTRSVFSALALRLAGYSAYGYAYKGSGFLMEKCWGRERFEHAAEANWRLAGYFLGLSRPFANTAQWSSSQEQRDQARALLAASGLEEQSYVVLCPFTGPGDKQRRKRWPGFAALAGLLAEQGVPVLLCPGEGEELQAAELGLRAHCLPGVDLGVYGALMQMARAVVANDTGPGHLAAATGVRLAAVYGPHSPPENWPTGANVLLFHDLLGWPTPEGVAQKLLEGR